MGMEINTEGEELPMYMCMYKMYINFRGDHQSPALHIRIEIGIP